MNNPSRESPQLPLGLGCPVWNCDAWADIVFPTRTPRREWLAWYSSMFNCVEGNSSFYAIPSIEHARRWGQEAARGFEFCLKFPRVISHELMLRNANSATREFLAVLEVLGAAQKLGPAFLQLGPDFGPDRFDCLAAYLHSLPAEFPFAVEIRHHDWFDSGPNEQRLDELLHKLEMDKVLFDSRPLYQRPPDDAIERTSQTRKPKTPLRMTATAMRPMLRLVGRNRIELVDPYIDEWLPALAEWISEGRRPIVFTHAPDDAMAPQLARRFAERFIKYLERDSDTNLYPQKLPELPKRPKQLDLFS